MDIKLNNELNPIYETILLLYQGYDLENLKNKVIEEITATGGNGEEFYQKNFKLIDKYCRSFQQYRITSERDAFYFKDTSLDFFNSFITPYLLNKDFINNVNQMSNEEILQIIMSYSNEIFEIDISDYINMPYTEFIRAENLTKFINMLDLNENEKWKMLLILQNLKDYYGHFTELIHKNIPAFEKSIEAIKPKFDKILAQYRKQFTDYDKVMKFLKEFNFSNCDIHTVGPSMVTASGVYIIANHCYIGLLWEKSMADLGYLTQGNAYIITCLKALSDNSKFEILTSLKESPKYATELALQLGLTSATVSHHMNALLVAQLVYVEKSNGKYYYHVNKETVKDMLERLGKKLL